MTLGLGIDTSFDDTAVALVRDGNQIEANLTVSQFAEHAEFGGVVPERASRLHVEMIFPLLTEALGRVGKRFEDLDYIAVSNKPGLVGSLLIGVTVAKSLAMALQKPLIGVNHLEAHIHAGLMEHEDLRYPFTSLLISGANTLVLDCQGHRDYVVMGGTLDDAVGECIDKCGRFLGLPMPAGPALQELALKGDPKGLKLPRPMMRKPELRFSFSGLKTAVLYALRDNPDLKKEDVAASLLQAISDVLVGKTMPACGKLGHDKVLLCGGAAANKQIREAFEISGKKSGVKIFYPSIPLCTDNAAMVAGIAHEDFVRGEFADLSLPVRAMVNWKTLS
jgi:N6-L-threonylcarbamoyladenine synthase